jgi:XTP/dITP diphosphohydrolase
MISSYWAVGGLINIFGTDGYATIILNVGSEMSMLRFVTTNRHKFREMQEIGGKHGITLEMVEMSYPEIQSPELEEVALEGGRYLSSELGRGFFVEDSGLFIESLGGFPGPYSSYVQKTVGNDGILRLLGNSRERAAHFLSVICHFDGDFKVYEGRVEGRITPECRGNSGFGFDPIFCPEGSGLTFAEMGGEKNKFSHRARCAEIFFRSLPDAG